MVKVDKIRAWCSKTCIALLNLVNWHLAVDVKHLAWLQCVPRAGFAAFGNRPSQVHGKPRFAQAALSENEPEIAFMEPVTQDCLSRWNADPVQSVSRRCCITQGALPFVDQSFIGIFARHHCQTWEQVCHESASLAE